MRSVNDAKFFNTWQILYRATCPNATETQWKAGDVEWRKERHSFFGTSYAISLEMHLLSRIVRNGEAWVLLVVIENWWNAKRDVLKSSTWARVLEGNPKSVVAWMREKEQNPADAAEGEQRR